MQRNVDAGRSIIHKKYHHMVYFNEITIMIQYHMKILSLLKSKKGVRIEDDVLITKVGNLVLSKNVPKEINDIEKLMKRESFHNKLKFLKNNN